MVSARLPHTIPAYIRSTAIVLALILALGGGVPAVVYTASLTVTTTADELNHDGDCSLREAIRAANLDVAVDACAAGHGSDTISLPAGVYTLTLAGAGEDAAATGDLDMTADLTVMGAGATQTIVDGNDSDRVFEIIAGKVTISGVSIRAGNVLDAGDGGGLLNTGGDVKLVQSAVSGNVADDGSGIYNIRTLELENSSVVENGDSFWNGGGIYNAGTLTLTKSTVRGNGSSEDGGGIFSEGGTLKVVESTISNNVAVTGSGGGISGGGTIIIIDSSISDNIIDDGEGAGVCGGLNLTITGSTISGNQSLGVDSYGGGGIGCAANLKITNSTISGNKTWGYGGGILSNGTAILNNVTIANNTADIDGDGDGDGGGVRIFGTFKLKNSIIALNHDSGGQAPDCAGTLTSQGYNLIQNTAGCTIAGDTTGNRIGVSPSLGPLADNGGPTLTQALNSGSPAIDRGSPSGCKDSQGQTLTSDQRGYPRPPSRRCDIGAYEVVVFLRVYLPAVWR